MLEEELSRTFLSGRWQNASVAAKKLDYTSRDDVYNAQHCRHKIRQAEQSTLFKD
jgi:hypothetical protein